MRIGVAPGAYTNDLLAALRRRINIEAEIVSPERDPDEYRYVLAVDDDPVPPSNDVRRYITRQTSEAPQWTVVAARHLLPIAVERGVALPIAVSIALAQSLQKRARATADIQHLHTRFEQKLAADHLHFVFLGFI